MRIDKQEKERKIREAVANLAVVRRLLFHGKRTEAFREFSSIKRAMKGVNRRGVERMHDICKFQIEQYEGRFKNA